MNIFTRKSHNQYLKDFEKFKQEVKKNMNLIINEHKNFGISAVVSYNDDLNSYYPCEYIKTLDAEYGMIRIYEPSIKAYHDICVCELVIDK